MKGDSAVDWHRQPFPAVEHEGTLLHEAYGSRPGLLPHMHHDQNARYPRAVVEHELGDHEPEEDTVLEQRGIGLGRQAPRPLARAPVRTPDSTPVELLCFLDQYDDDDDAVPESVTNSSNDAEPESAYDDHYDDDDDAVPESVSSCCERGKARPQSNAETSAVAESARSVGPHSARQC